MLRQKTNVFVAGNSILSVMLLASRHGFLYAQLAHMTPRQLTIWHARCHLEHSYLVIVATSVNRYAISLMHVTVSR